MLATGRLPAEAIPGNFTESDTLLGMEFSGRSSDGKRLMGLRSAQALATTVVQDRRFCWPVPDAWSLEEASTVPVAYATAYYALIVRGELQKGEKVLIHSGAGGVGMAAIAIALTYDCEIFVTVGSREKREFLLKKFPGLKEENFANSRTADFEEKVLERTKGKGVDVVLNSLSEDKLESSIRCLALHGRFLEIGKFDMAKNSALGMACFLKNISFHGILLDALFACEETWAQVCQLLTDGIEDGIVKPLPSTVFEADKVYL